MRACVLLQRKKQKARPKGGKPKGMRENDDFYYYTRWRLKLEGETESICVCTKERKGVSAEVLMATRGAEFFFLAESIFLFSSSRIKFSSSRIL